MPFLQEKIAVLAHQPLDTTEFCRGETEVESERNRMEPKLCRLVVTVYVNMGRFIRLVAVEVHPVWPSRQPGRHVISMSFSAVFV
jgi:hypothetical protein